MKHLSSIVARTAEISRIRNIGYPEAAIAALKEAGYLNPRQQVGVTYYLNNDIAANERYSLSQAVLAELGKRGGNVAAANKAKAGQLLFSNF